MDSLLEISGFVENIVYRNADNGYTVMDFSLSKAIDGEEHMTVVGIFPVVSEGETLDLQGSFTDHPTYGRQFKMQSYQVSVPADEVAMERYLASGAIKGIGPKMASKIVNKFGMDTFRIIEEEPERLAEIKGISLNKAMEIAGQINDTKDVRNAMVFMEKYGIHSNTAVKVYNKYGNQIYSILQENPYRLADEVEGIGFKRADEIASKIGIAVDSEFRIRSGLEYVLSNACAQGHTFLPRSILIKSAQELLQVDESSVSVQIDNLCFEKRLIQKKDEEDDQIYLRMFYRLEDNTAVMLKSMDVDMEYNQSVVASAISAIEKKEKMEFDELQKQAIEDAAGRGVFVLTGGPGTGKTTTIKAMIYYFEEMGMSVALAAPTGRAAKRMSEACGYEAKTIHRLLEVNGMSSENDGVTSGGYFDRNEDNPLEEDVIIIDETSMVDIYLIHSLLKAMVTGQRLILVGDVNQLPSVGPGNVLKDIIGSELFSCVALKKIFRQGMESDIVVNAHKIQDGEEIVLDNKSKDFFFLKRTEAEQVINVMVQLMLEKLPKYVNCRPVDIQVLTPTRKGLLGVENLNGVLQRYLNPPEKGKREHAEETRIFREGDKVMQTKNNYKVEWEILGKYGIPIDKGMGVFNGDVGVIKEINDFSKSMTVEFDEGKRVEYALKDLSELDLAYALTVHKSQGSEYPAVVMPLMSGPRMLMSRNILYTGITRAKKCVAIVGEEQVFTAMAANTQVQKRYCGLKDRLKE